MATISKIIRVVEQGPSGPQGATGATGAAGTNGSDASVTAANVAAAMIAGPEAIRAALENPTAAGALTITAPVANSGHSHRLGVRIAGTYTGTASKLQARIGTGDWVDVSGIPASGAFDGYAKLPPGSGTLTVRKNESAVTATVAGVAVGAVFAVAGQSNALGAADTTTGPEYTGTRGSRMFANPTNGTAGWTAMTNPTSYSASAHESCWPAMVSYLEEQLNMPVSIVFGECVGGSGFEDNRWGEGDDLYEATVTRLNNSGVRYFDGLLWDQGEDEAANEVSAATYQGYLAAMWTALKVDVPALAGSKLFAALVANDGHGAPAATGLEAVRAAVIALADDPTTGIHVGAPRFAGMSAANISTDSVHNKLPGDMDLVARKWARILRAHLLGGVAARGPRIDSVLLAGTGGLADDKIRFLFAENSHVRNAEATGWEIEDTNTGTLTVSAAAVVDGGIELTVTPDPEGTVTASYGKQISALATVTADEGPLAGLPVEPFVDLALGSASPTNLLDGLVAYYAMSEGSGNRADSSGNGHTLVQSGTVAAGTGLLAANAAQLSSSNYLATAAGIGARTSGFAISVWVNNNGVNRSDSAGADFAEIVNNLTNSTGGGQFRLAIDGAGRVYFYLFGNGNDAPGIRTSGTVIPDSSSTWTHIYAQWDGTATPGDAVNTTALAHLKLYVNGVEALTPASSGTDVWTTVDPGNAALKVGLLGSTYSHYRIEQLVIWDAPLNAVERALVGTSPGVAYADY